MEYENSIDENSAPTESLENENTQISSEKQINRAPRDPNRFPTTRIRAIMRMDPDLTIASQESVYLISKAAVSKVSIVFLIFLFYSIIKYSLKIGSAW